MGRPILFLTHEFRPFRGGVATYVESLASAVSHSEIPVRVGCLGNDDGTDSTLRFAVERWGGNINLQLPAIIRVYRALLRNRQTILDNDTILGSWGVLVPIAVLSSLGYLDPRNCVVILHGSELLKIRRSLLYKFLFCSLFKKVRFIATTSHHVQSVLLENFQADCLPETGVLPCGLPGWMCQLAEQEQGKIEKTQVQPDSKLQYPTGKKLTVLTLARIHPRKGQLETAKALSLLPPELKEKVCYLVAGKGQFGYLKKVIDTCEAAGIEFHCIGPVPDEKMAETYESCDIYVMSSLSLKNSIEGFGITYLEAGYFGKPVVGYETGGVSEAVRHEHNGFLAEEGNTEQLAGYLQQLLENQELRKEFGNNGKLHAHSFCWHSTAGLLLKFLGRESEACPLPTQATEKSNTQPEASSRV